MSSKPGERYLSFILTTHSILHATLDLAWTAVSGSAVTLSKSDGTLGQAFSFILTAVPPARPLIGVGATYTIKSGYYENTTNVLGHNGRKVSTDDFSVW